jgi:ABC-type multidrug transport system fused ATPase/permease subunit
MSESNERSLNRIKRDTEQARAELTDTVGQIRSQVTETASGLRRRASPEAIKAEVASYFRSRGERLLDTVIHAARDNPMQAVAVGASVAYPLLRIVRSIPVPVLLVGAGLFLAGSKTARAGSRKVSTIAAEFADDMGDRASELKNNASEAQQRVAGHFTEVGDSIATSLENLKRKASAAGDSIGATVGGVKEQAFAARESVSGGFDSLRAEATAVLKCAADIAAETTFKIHETAGTTWQITRVSASLKPFRRTRSLWLVSDSRSEQ